jgi:hypothetical protein
VNVSRSDELRAQLEAELAVAELEEQLAAEKEAGEVSRDTKNALREARQRFRDLRAGVPAGEGDAVAGPGTVEASAGVGEVS